MTKSVKTSISFYFLATLASSSDSLSKARCYYRLASTLIHLKNAMASEQAFDCLQQALLIYDTVEQKDKTIEEQIIKSYALQLKCAMDLKKGEAIKSIAKTILSLATDERYNNFVLEAHRGLYAVYFSEGNFDKATKEITNASAVANYDHYTELLHEIKIELIKSLSEPDTDVRAKQVPDLLCRFYETIFDENNRLYQQANSQQLLPIEIRLEKDRFYNVLKKRA